jgi:hypothetical protein
MSRTALILALGFSLSAAACQKKADEQPPPPAAVPAPPPPPAATPAPAPVPTPAPAQAAAPGSDIPTPEDFEQQAENEINPQNLEAELDRLEKEIGK